jgi:hypothetical protein
VFMDAAIQVPTGMFHNLDSSPRVPHLYLHSFLPSLMRRRVTSPSAGGGEGIRGIKKKVNLMLLVSIPFYIISCVKTRQC